MYITQTVHGKQNAVAWVSLCMDIAHEKKIAGLPQRVHVHYFFEISAGTCYQLHGDGYD